MSHSGSQRALGRSSYSVTGALEALGYLDTQALRRTGTQGTWVLGDSGIWALGHSGIWALGNSGTWALDAFEALHAEDSKNDC